MTKGHLTLIRCDELPEPTPAPAASEPRSVYCGDHRVTVRDFITACGPRTPTRTYATITVDGGHGVMSAELDRSGIVELNNILMDMLLND